MGLRPERWTSSALHEASWAITQAGRNTPRAAMRATQVQAFEDEAGDLTGVFVAKDTTNRNAVVVSSYGLCQFLGGRTAGERQSRRVVIFPFFWSRTTWNNGAGSSTCPPGQTCQPLEPISQPITVNPVNPPSQGGVTVTAPGVGVQVGPVGATGPAGPVGPPGASPDPNAIAQAVITAVVLKEIPGQSSLPRQARSSRNSRPDRSGRRSGRDWSHRSASRSNRSRRNPGPARQGHHVRHSKRGRHKRKPDDPCRRNHRLQAPRYRPRCPRGGTRGQS